LAGQIGKERGVGRYERLTGEDGRHIGGHGLAAAQTPERTAFAVLQLKALALAHRGEGLIDACG